MIVHLVDGTYELFRHFYGARRATNGADTRFGGLRGVLAGVLQMGSEGNDRARAHVEGHRLERRG